MVLEARTTIGRLPCLFDHLPQNAAEHGGGVSAVQAHFPVEKLGKGFGLFRCQVDLHTPITVQLVPLYQTSAAAAPLPATVEPTAGALASVTRATIPTAGVPGSVATV